MTFPSNFLSMLQHAGPPHSAARTAHRVMGEVGVTVVTEVPAKVGDREHNQTQGSESIVTGDAHAKYN